MIYVEALKEFNVPEDYVSVFLAGGITGAPDWQRALVEILKDSTEKLVLFNPRRKDFPLNDPSAAQDQITWEYKMLRKVDIVSFWFVKETLNPITLFELGAQSSLKKVLIVGTDPEYSRRQDILEQMSLARPGNEVVNNLDDIAQMIRYWYGMLRK